jgi:hypothetical protein
MIFLSFDPLAFGMAGLALSLSLVALLFVIFYVRKLALAAAQTAVGFHRLLEAYGFFDELDDEEDGDDSDDSDDSGPDSPTPPALNIYATAPLPEAHPDEETEADATLAMLLHSGMATVTQLHDEAL